MLLEQIAHVAVSQVKTRELVSVSPSTRLGDVVTQIQNAHTGAAVVVENGELVGIFTEHDLLRRIDHRNNTWRDQPVSTAMTRRPRIIREDDPVAEALRRMDVGKHRHLPIVRGRTPIAIVSIRDLLAYLTSRFPADFINLPPDPDKEARAPWGG